MGHTILVADDSPTIQKKASGILTGEGLDVVTVSNGVAAVKKLPTVNPLVVLADVSMPGKDGYEVCEHIKSNAGLSNIFVVLIFSDTDPYEEAKGSRVNADGRIKKPFDRDELVGTVAKFVAQAEASARKAAALPPPPPAEYEVEPIESEQPSTEVSPAADLAAFSEGVAFGVPSGEEAPAMPAEPMLSEPMQVEPALNPEAPAILPDIALEGAAEPAPLVSDSEPAFVAEPEIEPPAPELVTEPEPGPQAAEPILVEEEPAAVAPAEESAEHTMMFRAPGDIAQPIFSDELESPAPVAEATADEPPSAVEYFPEPPAAVEPAAEPQPVEMVPEPASVDEAASVQLEEQPADITPPEGTPIPPTSLESYTLGDAAAGQVRFAPPDTEVPQEPEPKVVPGPQAAAPEPVPAAEAPQEVTTTPEPAALAPAPAVAELNPEQVFSVVHKVVLKMSPPALSPQVIEEIARRLADEITAELQSGS